MVEFAEKHRDEKDFQKAGDIYRKIADQNADSSRRAEWFYKGGLLIFQAGNKDQSIELLTKASEDANNYFYANLAKERLKQLQ